jgi:cold-inducible RNA-binding protein
MFFGYYYRLTIFSGGNMAKKLYVGNLSYNISEEELRNVFTPMGEVQSCKIITDAATGRSKGFGFIEMMNDEDADKAIASLNGTTVMDRALNVSEARPQTERSGGRGGRPGGGRGGFDRGGSGGGRNKNSWR